MHDPTHTPTLLNPHQKDWRGGRGASRGRSPLPHAMCFERLIMEGDYYSRTIRPPVWLAAPTLAPHGLQTLDNTLATLFSPLPPLPLVCDTETFTRGEEEQQRDHDSLCWVSDRRGTVGMVGLGIRCDILDGGGPGGGHRWHMWARLIRNTNDRKSGGEERGA